MSKSKKAVAEEVAPAYHNPPLDVEIARATTRLSIIATIINDLNDQSPGDAFSRAYDLDSGFEDREEKRDHGFIFGELTEALIPGLQALQQKYVAKVTDLVAKQGNT